MIFRKSGWWRLSLTSQILATIFIRLVLVIIAPLIFSTLVTGIAGQGDLRRLGGLALRSFGFFVGVTTAALALAFGLANLLQPGRSITPGANVAIDLGAPQVESCWIRLFPRSTADAMARGDVLPIVVFSILLAIAVSLVGEAGRPVLDLCRSLARVMYTFTDMVMATAPAGVFGAAAALVSQQGIGIGAGFLRLIVAVYLGLALLLLALYPLLDMPRTAVNTAGNCLAAALVARWQGNLPESSGGPRDHSPRY